MKTYKCSKCGNVMTVGETLYACSKCGCSADNFIVIDEAGTTSNNYSASSAEQQKNESGSNSSAQQTKDYDVICPDCNSVIMNEDSDCPVCGCPSNMFIKRAKTKFVHGEKLECPDCGKVFAEIIPADCPNCGCPSEKFKEHEERVPQKPSTQKKSSFPAILIFLFLVGAIGYLYWEYNKAEKAAEQARQEQYQKEQQAQREREEREREERRKKQEEQNQQNQRRKNALCKNKWRYRHGDPYGQCMLETVGFNINGTAWCDMTYYAGGNKIKTNSFDFTYSINGDFIYVQGEKAYYYDGYSLELWPSGKRFKEVSRWDF